MSQLGIPGVVPSGVGAVSPIVFPSGGKIADYLGNEIDLTATIFKIYAIQQNNNDSVGAGTPQLGANCPATTLTAPYKWIKMYSSDGYFVYVPAWK
jgi:hypothetical protein